ncbi:hypothetical protein ACQ4PT_020692 [Festuca glaucescens]
MEAARGEGDELIADYVDCLMSLDTNARFIQNGDLILGAPVVEAGLAASVGCIMEQDAMQDFAPPEAPKEPMLGMTFESDEAAKTFYNEYARCLGFPFRVGRSRRSKGADEVAVMKRFVCSREGMYTKKNPSSGEATKKRERMSMREGCNAMMEVVRESNHWVVSKLETAHNHDLGTCSRVGYLRATYLLDGSDKITMMGSDRMPFPRQNVLGEGGDAQVDPRLLPPDYFLMRWTRKARDDGLFEYNGDNHHEDVCESIASRYDALCADAIRCAEKGSGSETVYKAAKDILQKAYEEVIAYERNPVRVSQRDAININEDVMIDDTMTNQSLPDSGRKVTNLLT